MEIELQVKNRLTHELIEENEITHSTVKGLVNENKGTNPMSLWTGEENPTMTERHWTSSEANSTPWGKARKVWNEISSSERSATTRMTFYQQFILSYVFSFVNDDLYLNYSFLQLSRFVMNIFHVNKLEMLLTTIFARIWRWFLPAIQR